jgi:hypothetical protein
MTKTRFLFQKQVAGMFILATSFRKVKLTVSQLYFTVHEWELNTKRSNFSCASHESKAGEMRSSSTYSWLGRTLIYLKNQETTGNSEAPDSGGWMTDALARAEVINWRRRTQDWQLSRKTIEEAKAHIGLLSCWRMNGSRLMRVVSFTLQPL